MKLNVRDIWINRVGMVIIIIASLGYILFGSSFAQLRWEPSFLNFPIFIGEILLGISCLLFIAKSAGQKQELGPWAWILGAYLFFILLKAFLGYFAWGPLAFRDAALFYYPLFILLGYSFWSNDPWWEKARRFFIVVILSILIFHQFFSFWSCTLMITGIILALQAKDLKERMVLIGAVFIFAPYGILLGVLSRTILLATLSTAILIGAIVFLFFCKNPRWRIVIGILACFIIGVVLFKASQTKEGRTFFIRDVQPLVSALPQEPSRAKCLFHPVGSSPDKPDAIQEFLKRIHQENPVAEKQNVIEKKNTMEKQNTIEKQNVMRTESTIKEENKVFDIKEDDTLFRFYIWRDMAVEYARYKPLFGFAFGRPLCSLAIAKYFGIASTEYVDGWVGAHNSFFYMLYRGGIIGLAMVLTILFVWFGLLRDFYILKDWTGLLLCAVLLNWFVSANFFLIFELPYTAIPVWTIFGVALKHRMLLKNEKN